jgi:hypothetical protein
MNAVTGNAVDLLENVIATQSPDAAERFRRLFKRFAGRYQGVDEIGLLNRFWRTQLGILNVNTIREREWLVDDVDGNTWVMFFQNNVLPTVLREDLPKPL